MIVLGILKTTGIVLLIAAAVIIALILLLLFVPIRYRLEIEKPGDKDSLTKGKVNVSWLLHFVNGSIDLAGDKEFILRILGIKLDLKRIMSKGSGKKKGKKGGKTEKKEAFNEGPEGLHDDFAEAGKSGGYDKDTASAKDGKRRIRPADAVRNILRKIIYRVSGIIRRTAEVVRKLLEVIRFLWDEGNINGIVYILTEVYRIIKRILPKHIRGHVGFGSGDPCTTGQITAAASALWPVYGKELTVTPDFNEKFIEADVEVNGYLMLVSVVSAAVKIFLNRESKNVIKYILGKN